MGLLLLNHGAGGSPSHRRNGRTLPWLMTFPIHCCLSSTYPFKQLSVFVSHMFTHPLFALHLIKKWWIQSFQSWGPSDQRRYVGCQKLRALKPCWFPSVPKKDWLDWGVLSHLTKYCWYWGWININAVYHSYWALLGIAFKALWKIYICQNDFSCSELKIETFMIFQPPKTCR